MPPGIGYKRKPIDPRLAELLGGMGAPFVDPRALLDDLAMPMPQDGTPLRPALAGLGRGDLTSSFTGAPAQGDMLTPEPDLSFAEEAIRNTPEGLIRSSIGGGKALVDMLTTSNIPRGTTTGQMVEQNMPQIKQAANFAMDNPAEAAGAILPGKEDFRKEGLGAIAGLEDLVPGGTIAKLLGSIGAATMIPGKINRMGTGPLRRAQQAIAGRDAEFPDANLGSTPELPATPIDIPNMQAGERISTRLPTASREKNPGLEDGILDNTLRVDMETFNKNPKLVNTFAEHRKGHPDYVPGADASDAGVLEDLKKMTVDNLLWLHDQIPEDIRNRSKKWYDGANRIAGEFGQQFGVTREAAAGVLASQSPQRDWFQNIALAERIMDVHQNKGQHVWDAAMDVTAGRIYKKQKFQDQLSFVAGKKYDDLVEPMDKAMWLRAYSETHHANQFHIYSPEGNKMGLQLTGKGANHQVGWGSLSEVATGINVLDAPMGGQTAAIAEQMGAAHKVRNFYNNIIDPNSNMGDVTMDTHAIAAAHLRPLAGGDLEVDHNLGGGGSDSRLGLTGNYAVYADAYREAAAARGVLPREMQSITWEAIRSLYSPAFKNTGAAAHGATLKKKVAGGLAGKKWAVKSDGVTPKMTAQRAEELWEGSLEQTWRESYQTGKVTIDQMREEIMRRAGGFDRPDWLE